MEKNHPLTNTAFYTWTARRIRTGCLAAFLFLLFYSLVSFALEFSESYLMDIAKKYGDYPRRRLVAWEKIIKENKNVDERKKLEAVNNFMNLIEYRNDMTHWGVADYWATPLEFVVSGAGDCEDFSIAKYFTLLELGVPDEKFLIMYVKLNEGSGKYDQAHMVLTYYEKPGSIPLVLDNVNKEILPADKRPDLQPIYGFNGVGLWQAKELGKGNKIGDSKDLKRWANVADRMKSGQIGKWVDE